MPQIDTIGLSVASGFSITAAQNARTLRGSGADPNSDVHIFHGGRQLLSTRSNRQGLFSHTFSPTEIEHIGQVEKSFFVSQVDAAGNRGDSAVVQAVVNTTTGSALRDLLTGVDKQRDIFRWDRLDHSLLNRYDTITNFESNDRISIGRTRYQATVKRSSGLVENLDRLEINEILGRSNFAADSIAAIRQRGLSGTFLVINDDRPGFQAATDAVIYLAGFNISNLSNQITIT